MAVKGPVAHVGVMKTLLYIYYYSTCLADAVCLFYNIYQISHENDLIDRRKNFED